MHPDDRDRLAVAAIVGISAVTAVANVATEPGTVPPLLVTVVPFIAAAFFGVRTTVLVALISVVETALLARFSDGYTGMAFASRMGMTVGSGILAIALAQVRVARETEISAARHELRLAALLQAMVDTAKDPIYAKDAEGRYLAANNAAARTLGVEHGSELVGLRDRDFLPDDRAARIETADRETFASGGRLEFEEEIDVPERRILLTHKTVISDPDGEVVGLSGIAKDVTIKRHAQQELERSEHRFRSLVEASSDIVWRTDWNGAFVEPQGGWQQYTGQTWDEQEGFSWLDAVHPDDREHVALEWRTTVHAGSFHETSVRLWNTESSSYRTVIIRAAPVAGPDGVVTEWLCACEDNHDQFIAEQRLRRIAEARALVAEVASAGAVASGTRQVAEGALAVLLERLPDHVASITLLDRDDPAVTTRFAVSGIDGGVSSLPPTVEQLDLPSSHVSIDRRPIEFADADELVTAYPDAASLTEVLGVAGPTFVIPLDTGARVMGALTISFREAVEPQVLEVVRFSMSELTAVLANSLLQSEFHEREAEIASTLQQSMLELAIEADPRLALSFHYQAGAEQMEAGGDWYDVAPLADGRIALIVGDVVGRSLAAATVMGRLRGACRGLLLTTDDASEVVSGLDAVAETIEGARYSTCCVVVLDPATQTATYCSAGHPPVLLLPAEGEPVFLWDAQGPPLTVPVTSRSSTTVACPTGSRLILYTDGLVERRNEVIDKGLDRLAGAAVSGRHLDVEQHRDHIATLLFDDFAQNDDVAIVCAEVVSERADELARTLPPDTAVLHRVRRDMRSWLAGHRVTGDRAQEILLAVGEALANAIEHSSPTRKGIQVSISRSGPRHIEAVVQDDGRWRENAPDPTRGRGLAIMRTMADHVQVDQAGDGTRVRLTFSM